MKKRIDILLVLMLILFLATGCVMSTGSQIYDNEEMLIKDYNRYSLVHSTGNVTGNCLSGSAEKLEGMGIIWKFKAADNTEVTLTYRIKVYSGRAKLVLISQDGTLTHLAECVADSEDEGEGEDIIQVKKGDNLIKLVGDRDTKIEYEISLDKGTVAYFGS